MNVLADARQVANRFNEALARVTRMWTREANSLDARNVVDLREQVSEVALGIIRRRIVIHDLAEKLNFLSSRSDRLPNVGQDIRLGAHPLVPARVWHDAERAVVVAALDDRDVRLHGV